MENKILKSELVTRFWIIKDCMFSDYSDGSLFSRNFKRDLFLIPAHKIGKVEIAEQQIYRYAEIRNSEISAKEHLDIELCKEEAK